MTALGLRRLRLPAPRVTLTRALFVGWAVLVLGGWLRFLPTPGGIAVLMALTFLVPPVLVGLALARGSDRVELAAIAGGSVGVVATILLPNLYSREPVIALGIVASVVAAVIAHRHPRGSLTVLFATIGFNGTLTAYTPIQPLTILNLVMVGLWLGILGRLVIGHRRLPLQLSPSLVLLASVMVIVLCAVVAAPPGSGAIGEFRSVWLPFSAVLLVGFGAFTSRTLDGAAKAMAVISLLVGAYATLRWAIGPSAAEAELNESDQFRDAYNSITSSSESKVSGSLFNGQQLAVWVSVSIPFLLAAAIGWRGRYRMVALAGLPLSIIAMFGSGQRTAVPAVIAGALTVVLIHVLARSFRGPRLGVALASVFVLLASASIVYPAVVDNPEKRQRYENILSPSEDRPFQERLVKWRQVLVDLQGQPLGYGLGAGDSQIPKRFVSVAYNNIDNSYLMVAYDLGIAFGLLFLVTLCVLLTELVRHAVWIRAERSSVLLTAAAGVLVSLMIELMAANKVTSPPILAGWLVVGLGLAQFGSRREAEAA